MWQWHLKLEETDFDTMINPAFNLMLMSSNDPVIRHAQIHSHIIYNTNTLDFNTTCF